MDCEVDYLASDDRILLRGKKHGAWQPYGISRPRIPVTVSKFSGDKNHKYRTKLTDDTIEGYFILTQDHMIFGRQWKCRAEKCN